jgi:histidyl-tRNA synthetase
MKDLKSKKQLNKPRVLKGFRDFLPETMRVRQFVLKKFIETFEEFGYEPLETPALEYQDVLLGKYGKESDRLVYTFKDKGGRGVGLRYDLTVPISRVLAMYKDKLVLPFKRYQVQPVFRAEKPQRGRFREFIQADFDIFGVKTPLADAEIIAVTYQALRKIGLSDFMIKINSRRVLFKLLDGLKVEKRDQPGVLQSLDKMEKIGKEGVSKELLKKGFDENFTISLLEAVGKAKPDANLLEVLRLVESFGIPKKYFKFDPSLARGLDYYTGPIYETYVTKPKIGSITGGGRYDELIEQLGGPSIPATGTTIGLDRICEVLAELGILEDKVGKSSSRVLVASFEDSLDYGLSVLSKL